MALQPEVDLLLTQVTHLGNQWVEIQVVMILVSRIVMIEIIMMMMMIIIIHTRKRSLVQDELIVAMVGIKGH